MLTIAGGILIALLVLAFLPLILESAVWLLLVGVLVLAGVAIIGHIEDIYPFLIAASLIGIYLMVRSKKQRLDLEAAKKSGLVAVIETVMPHTTKLLNGHQVAKTNLPTGVMNATERSFDFDGLRLSIRSDIRPTSDDKNELETLRFCVSKAGEDMFRLEHMGYRGMVTYIHSGNPLTVNLSSRNHEFLCGLRHSLEQGMQNIL